jgi:hypothetical protein
VGGEDADGDEANTPDNDTPVAFLCHGSEDKVTVRRLAEDLMAAGIDVFFHEWEIRSGDSLRRKIDGGLGKCSHFVAVLSPISVTKPWVNAEMDAAFVRKMNSEVKFIALRLGLPVGDLPPLLQGSHSPALDNYETDLASLVSDIHGISRKPPLGPKPSSLGGRTDGIGLSPAAEMVVRLMVEQSEHGDALDPHVGAEELQEATGLIDDDIEDAVDELSGQGFIQKHVRLGGGGTLGFTFVTPEGELFAKFDSHYKSWDPAKDAVTLASHLLAAGDNGISVPEAAGEFGWEPRRMNPAIHYLVYRRLVDHGNEMGNRLLLHPEARLLAQSDRDVVLDTGAQIDPPRRLQVPGRPRRSAQAIHRALQSDHGQALPLDHDGKASHRLMGVPFSAAVH